MRCDIEGIRMAAKILKNVKSRLKDSSDLIDNIIARLSSKIPQNVSQEEVKMYEERYRYVKGELRSLQQRINGDYVNSATSIKKWIKNKADKLDQSEELSKNVLSSDLELGKITEVEGIEISEKENKTSDNLSEPSPEIVNQKLSNIYKKMINVSENEKLFTQKELSNTINKIVTCTSDKEFEQIYKNAGLKGNASKVDSFRYNGKIYVRQNASEHTIMYEISRDMAIEKRKTNKSIKKPSSIPTQGINKVLAEFAARSLNNKTLSDGQKKYDVSIDFLESVDESLSKLGYVDLILKSGYGTKKELKETLKKVTGDDQCYNTMLKAMYELTENPNATKEDKELARKQLENIKKSLKKISNNQNDTEKPDDAEKPGDIEKPIDAEEPTENNGNEVGRVTKKIDGKDVDLPEGDKVYFLDTCWKKGGVQRGSDCFIIESKDENGNPIYGLIDSGEPGTSERVKTYLKELGIKELDFVLITHGHSDHTGGYQAIVDSGVEVKNVYMKQEQNNGHLNGVKNTTEKYNAELDEKIKKAKKENNEEEVKRLESLKTDIHYVNDSDPKEREKNQKITLGTYEIQLFNTEDRIKDKRKYKDAEGKETVVNENANTITALATSNGKSIYFAGDIGDYPNGYDKKSKKTTKVKAGTETAKEVRKYLDENGLELDVYKAAHHSRGGHNNSEKIVDILDPHNSVATIAKKRIDAIRETDNSKDKKDFVEGDDAIRKHVKDANGEMYYTAAGTVVMNVTGDGDLSLQQMDNHYTSDGKVIKKSKKT